MRSEATVTEWALGGVLDELADIHCNMQDRQFAFILGAGASVTSGIPSGQTLAKGWLEELHAREGSNSVSLEEWVQSSDISAGVSLDTAAEHYARIFERRFKGDSESGYAALELAMEGKSPSLGYSLLAEIIQNTRHKVVVTTNFDNLVADALAMHAHQSPMVVAHESLAGFVRPRLRRPLVAKIHRDLFYNPKNTVEGVSTMEEAWRTALRKLFQYFTPIVVGYGGNDGSLMNMLLSFEPGEIAGRMIWCYRDGSPPPKQARDVLSKHQGLLVRVAGFDEFVLQLAERLLDDFDVGQIAERMAALGTSRAQRYREQAEALRESSKQGTPAQQAAGKVIEKSVERGTTCWDWEQRALAAKNDDERNSIYRKAIVEHPTSADLLGNYALFLSRTKRDDATADAMFQKALELDPVHSNNTSNYGAFVWRRGDISKAEQLLKRAVDLGPQRARVIGRYASFLHKTRQDKAHADQMFKRAMALAPDSGELARAYAVFLAECNNDYMAAEALFRRGMELEPDNVYLEADFVETMTVKGDEASLLVAWETIDGMMHRRAPDDLAGVMAPMLFVGVLIAEMRGQPDPLVCLSRLKWFVTNSATNRDWSYDNLLKAALPRLKSDNKRDFLRAVAGALGDPTQLVTLSEHERWRELPSLDPREPWR